MAKLLISVRNAPEAEVALCSGADLIDVKEPANGSLGAPEYAAIEGVITAVAGRVSVSVALGELRDAGYISSLAIPRGVEYAKVGMADCAGWPDWQQRWAAFLARLPPQVQPVAVVYADARAAAPEPNRILDEAVRLGCGAVLVDTFDKSRGGLLDAWPIERLSTFVAAVRRQGMLAVVGGSLALETLRSVADLGPDFVALRGAVCRHGRSGPLDADRVRHAARQIALSNS